MRSSNGTEMHFLYFITVEGAQEQGLTKSPDNPQGQGYTQLNIFFLLSRLKEKKSLPPDSPWIAAIINWCDFATLMPIAPGI